MIPITLLFISTMKNISKQVEVILCTCKVLKVLTLCLVVNFIISHSLFSQITQTSGPIGGRFTHVAIVQKGWFQLSSGPHHVLAIDIEGHLWGWGRNDYGQIDGKFPSTVYEPSLIDSTNKWISVAAGGLHSLAVDSKGILYSWGNGERGQLGHRNYSHKSSFTKIDSVGINWALRIEVSQIKFSKVSAGYYHSMALTDHIMSIGQIYGFGDNTFAGPVGIQNVNAINIPMQIEYYPGEFINVFCGSTNTFAIKDDNSLWAWGYNNKGQLGNAKVDTNNYIPKQIGISKDWWQISAGVNHTIALKKDSSMWGWGQNLYFQLGDGTNIDQLIPKKLNNKKWKYISVGNYFTLAIDNKDSLFSWGANHRGQLGTGNTYYYNLPRFLGLQTKLFSAGYDYSVTINKDNNIFGFGDNESGRAGLGRNKANDSSWTKIPFNNIVIWTLNESYEDRVYVSRDKGTTWRWEKIDKRTMNNDTKSVSIVKYFKSDIYINNFSSYRKTSDLGYTWLWPNQSEERKFKAILGVGSTGSTLVQKPGFPDLYIENDKVSWDNMVGQSKAIKDERYNNINIAKSKTIDRVAYPFLGDRVFMSSPANFYNISRIYTAGYDDIRMAEVYNRGEVLGTVTDFSLKADTILVVGIHGLFKDTRKYYFKPLTDSTQIYNFSGLEYQDDFGIVTSKGHGLFVLNNNLNLSQIPIKMQYITDFAATDKILHVSTLGGGVFKSSNYGETWEELSTGLGEKEVYNIENIGNTLFATTDKTSYKLNANRWIQDNSFNLDSISLTGGWSSQYRVKNILRTNTKSIILIELYKRRGTITDYFTRIVFKPHNAKAYELKTLTEQMYSSQTYSLTSIDSTLFLTTSSGLYVGQKWGEQWSKIITPKRFKEVVQNEGALFARLHEFETNKTDSLLYVSKDNGQTWELFTKGLPQKITHIGCSKIYCSGGAVYSIIENKLWYSPIGTPNWKTIDKGGNNIPEDIKYTSVFEFGGNLLLGTEAHSVWKVQLSPVLISPTDSSNNMPLTNIEFEWSSTNGTQLYEFQLSDNINFTTTIHQEQTTNVTLKLPKQLNVASRYFWRVRLKNAEGIWSPWSAINVFATEFPTMFVRLSPALNTLNRTMIQPFYFFETNQIRKWGYQLQTAEDINFSKNVVTHYYDTTFFFHTFEKGKNYYYRVRQYDTTIGFGGKWYPESNYHFLAIAPTQVDFSPYRDVFSFGNYTTLMWQPEHYNKFDYSQFPGLQGTPTHWYPSYHDFIAAFGWQHFVRECCCIRRYLLFGPKKCQIVENYNTFTKWQQALRIWGYTWGGSCSGFSFHSIERWLKNQKPYSYSLDFSDQLQRKINQQQQFQLSKTYYSATYKRTAIGAVEFLRSIFNSNNRAMLPVLSLYAYNQGHAVVPYMITSGSQFDSIWVYDNWFHFTPDVFNLPATNKYIVVNKSNGLWTFPNGFGSGAWHGTIMDLTPVTSFVFSTPVLQPKNNNEKTLMNKSRGEFLLSASDSVPTTTVFMDNPDRYLIKDSKGKEYSLTKEPSLDSSNIAIIRSFGGLQGKSDIKILGAHIFADKDKSDYSIEKINTKVNDTSTVNIFGLGYEGEVKWKGDKDAKMTVGISDMSHGISLRSEKKTDILDFKVVKFDAELDYQKSIIVNSTSLDNNEEFFAGFSPDSKEFRISNNGKDKRYDIVVDLGIEVPIKNIKFGSKDIHIYRLKGLGEEDTTKLTIDIDRSRSGRSDTTIIYTSVIEEGNTTIEWYNKKRVGNLGVYIYPNPVQDDLTFSISLAKSTDITMSIVDQNGKLIKELINGYRYLGEYNVSTDVRGLSQGIYYLIITTPNQKISEQFVIIR